MRYLLLIMLLLAHPSHAGDSEKAREDAKSFIKSLDADDIGNVQEAFEAARKEDIAGTKGKSVPQSTLTNEQLSHPLTQKEMLAPNALEANETLGKIAPKPKIDAGDYQRALDIQTAPQTQADLQGLLSQHYEACTAPDVAAPPQARMRFCDSYQGRSEQQCFIGRQIDVDATHIYQCAQQSARITAQCTETLSLRCANIGTCVRLPKGVSVTDGSASGGYIYPRRVSLGGFGTYMFYRIELASDAAPFIFFEFAQAPLAGEFGVSVDGGARRYVSPAGDLRGYLVRGHSVTFQLGVGGKDLAIKPHLFPDKSFKIRYGVRCCTDWQESREEQCN